MSYLQQIAQRNSPMGPSATLLRPQPVHPFAAGQDIRDGLIEESVMDTPATASDPVTIIQSIQQHNLFTQAPVDATGAEKRGGAEEKDRPAYIRSQLERTVVQQQPVKGPTQAVDPADAHPHSNQKERELMLVAGNGPEAGAALPAVVLPTKGSEKDLPVRELTPPIVPPMMGQKPMPAVQPLMPPALQEPLPSIKTPPNKLVIGKITVEILPPAPSAKTRERIINRVVHVASGGGNSAGRSKLSFGLGQL